ncbi:MAG: 50S ribosomal protein L10, partial [Promethearchaeota archaeon]
LKQYKNIAVVQVANINDRQIQETRKLLRGKAVIRMSKKSIQLRAIEEFRKKSKKPNLDEFAKNIPGQASLIFTNLDVFELKKLFQENKWMVPAKPNEVTPVDIWVPAGDTGLPTGQVISELNMTLRLPTRIQNDTIWIRENTRTHKIGDFVTVKQAAVLKKLGITPIESTIKIHYAWADGELIPEEILYMDMEAFQQEVATAYFGAQKLAIELGIIDKETIEPLIQKAHREALALLFEMPIFDESMLDDYIKRAQLNANVINTTILGEGLKKPELKDKNQKKKKDTKEEKDEEVGIGNLFG